MNAEDALQHDLRIRRGFAFAPPLVDIHHFIRSADRIHDGEILLRIIHRDPRGDMNLLPRVIG